MRRLLSVLFLALALVAAGCGGDDDVAGDAPLGDVPAVDERVDEVTLDAGALGDPWIQDPDIDPNEDPYGAAFALERAELFEVCAGADDPSFVADPEAREVSPELQHGVGEDAFRFVQVTLGFADEGDAAELYRILTPAQTAQCVNDRMTDAIAAGLERFEEEFRDRIEPVPAPRASARLQSEETDLAVPGVDQSSAFTLEIEFTSDVAPPETITVEWVLLREGPVLTALLFSAPDAEPQADVVEAVAERLRQTG